MRPRRPRRSLSPFAPSSSASQRKTGRHHGVRVACDFVCNADLIVRINFVTGADLAWSVAAELYHQYEGVWETDGTAATVQAAL